MVVRHLVAEIITRQLFSLTQNLKNQKLVGNKTNIVEVTYDVDDLIRFLAICGAK